MGELKTKPNQGSVSKFLNTIENDQKRADCFEILKIMEEITGSRAKMWGNSLVGFGTYHYKYPTGTQGDMFLSGFSPRKQNLTIYIMSGFSLHEKLMSKLGKHSTGKSCLYIKSLEDVDLKVLKKLIKESVAYISKKYPSS